jgi:8-oxo-dGTP pyrophosphatase MutT (NUDIX family)
MSVSTGAQFPKPLVEPELAATVAVIRDTDAGLQTWMLGRAHEMAFAPGATAFPGGAVSPADADETIPWTEPDAESFASRMLVEPAVARAVVTAAFRELFEETGLLLTRPMPDFVGEDARAAVETNRLGLRELLVSNGLRLDVADVHPWTRWITPPSRPRRFDMWTFVTPTEPGQNLRAASREARSGGWVVVGDVLRAYDAHELEVLPPTAFVLRSLDAAGSVADVLSAAPGRRLEAIHPRALRVDDGGVTVVLAGTEELHVVRPIRQQRADGRP